MCEAACYHHCMMSRISSLSLPGTLQRGMVVSVLCWLLLLHLTATADPADEKPTTTFTVVAHSYKNEASHFDAFWNKMLPKFFVDDSSKNVDPSQFGGYTASKGHHRIICFFWGDRHGLFLVHFADEGQHDMALFLQCPEPFTWDQLKQCMEHLPLCLSTSKLSEGYMLDAGGEINDKVFERDFREQVVSAMKYEWKNIK